MPRNPPWFLALGAVTGVLAAASTLYPLADVGAPRLFGYCFGIDGPGGQCGGIEASFYLFPGVIFGIPFAAAQLWLGRLGAGRAAVFVLVSGIANAIAVFLCVWLFMLFGGLIELKILDAPLALAGAIAGAAGGVLLSGAATRLVAGATARRSIVAAAALGLLAPLATELEAAGVFLFYIVWQAGYALALASSLPPRT
jgi:hypothetical protein